MAMGSMGAGPAGDSEDELGDGGYRPLAEINVTPLVDVMLVLLIVFMVAAPLMMVGVPLKLPKTSAERVTPAPDPLVLSVDRDGKLFIRKEPVEEAALVQTLSALRGGDPNKVIYVRGDKQIDYGRIMQVMGLVGEAGYSRISLVAEGQEKSEAR
ncbi:biopolymer transporter ExbD [Ferrovibrio sp. MS7]|jgi:biopolymer transport protein ExbD|uniref:ExbD/TolR family protein n=1 Tax=Ferrovibrio plantarum TaxID=3119164 RepID=UPI001B7AA212|nr:biopolymer transporter ExbD [Ferrovibrio sp.]